MLENGSRCTSHAENEASQSEGMEVGFILYEVSGSLCNCLLDL